MTFSRNEKYWGKKPVFAKVLVKVITDSEARMLALETGEIDLVYGARRAPPCSGGHRELQTTEATGRRVGYFGAYFIVHRLL